MADFYQHGLIATMHDLGTIQRERLERMLERYVVNCQVGLVLPVTAGDMRAEPFARDHGGTGRRPIHPADRRGLGRGPDGGRLPRSGRQSPRAGGPRPRALDGRPARAGLVPTIERGRADGDDAGQRPLGVDRVRLSAGRPAAGGLRPARLRHRQLRPRDAGPAVPASGPPQPGFRVLQGLLRAGHRSHARPRRAIARFAAAASLDLAAGIRPVPGLSGLLPLSAVRRVCGDVQPGQVEPDSERLGPGGGHVGRGLPQHVGETRLPGGHLPPVRAQASVAVAGRSQQGPDEDGGGHLDQHFPHVGQHGNGAAAGALPHPAVRVLAFRPGRDPPLSCRRPDERPAF